LSADPGESGHQEETSDTPDGPPEPAGGRRRLVELRCGFAEMARKEADAAAQRVLETRRLYAGRLEAIATAESAVDPAATHSAKDDAHRAFRATVAAARDRGHVEAAANDWLQAINQINAEFRLVQAAAQRERDAAQALLADLTALSSTAESSEAMAVEAMAACEAAKAALAARPASETGSVDEWLDELSAEQPEDAAAIAAGAASSSPGPAALNPFLSMPPAELPEDEGRQSTDWLVIDIRSPEPQVAVRLMRRESRTFGALVDRLAGGDVAMRSCWQLLLSNFVDAVTAAAIDDASLDFEGGSPFWSQFSAAEAREVARGLAALGFRFDGFESFVGGRVPSQRDLALAVGAAGLLPARVRYWPKPEDAAALFGGVVSSGDAFIAAGAPALTLGELVRLLGRRAEPLADLWNDWDRVRPLLFETHL
jgi:hypothetical protein